ncbi:hypothetical protein KCU65_g9877, partial [Aureobasidium melanogenum]
MDDQSRAQHSRPSMAPPTFGYYPQHPFWAATIFEKYVGKAPASGYSTAQIDSVFFHLRMEMLELESRQSLDANTMWFRDEVERLRAERDGLLRAREEAASARLAHERAQIAHRNAQATHDRVLRVQQNTESTLRDIIREGNERNALLATQLASVQLAHEKAQIARIDLQTVHQKAQLDHENTKRDFEKRKDQLLDDYVTSQSRMYLLERDIAIMNKNHKEGKNKFEDDLLAIKKERDDLQAKCTDFESRSNHSIIRFVNKKQEIQQRETHIEHTWSQALQCVMSSTINHKIDIDDSVLNTILPPTISSIDKFTFKEQQQYCFAQSYFAKSSFMQNFFGRIFNTRQFTGDDGSYYEFDKLIPTEHRKLFLLDLMSPGEVTKRSSLGHDLDLMIYLERSLLQDTRMRQTSNTAILFAFNYLIRVTRSFYNEVIHSMACVHLAVLGMQYVMRDRAQWFCLVRGIITDERVTYEPLIKACHAYLALSTHDPQSLMEPELARAFELGRFSASTLLAIIVSLTKEATSGTLHGIDIVIAQSYEWEVVFWKAATDQSWSCSNGYIEVKTIDEGVCHMKWGSDPGQRIVLNVSEIPVTDLGEYIRIKLDGERLRNGESGYD